MSSLNDPRERTLVWLTTYFTSANVSDDNSNATLGFKMFEETNEYPLELLFIDLTADYIITIGEADLEVIRNADKTVDSYRENIPLTVSLIDKNGLTAILVKWKVERELRRIAETYFFGSLRQVESRQVKTVMLNAEKLHCFTYILSYLRSTG